jgi:hypothetical protein
MLEAVEKVSETFTKAKQEMKKNLLRKLEAVAAESEEAKISGFTKDVKKTENLNTLLSSLKVETQKERKIFSRKEQNKKMGSVAIFFIQYSFCILFKIM